MRFSQTFDSVLTGSVAGGMRSAAEAMQIGRPPAGSVQIADVQRAFAIKFGFDLADVKIAAVDVDLVLLFPDGGKLVLPGMALNLLSADPPRVSFNEAEVEPAVMMAQLGDIKLVDQVLATSLQSGDAGKENESQGSGEAARTQAPLPTTSGVGSGQSTSSSATPALELPKLKDTTSGSTDTPNRIPTPSVTANRPKFASSPPVDEAVPKLEAKSSVRLFGVTEAPDVAVEGKAWIVTNGFAAKPADIDPSLSAQTKTMSLAGTDHPDVINAADFSRVGAGQTMRRVELQLTPIGAETEIANTIRINAPTGFKIDGLSPILGGDGKEYYEFKANSTNTVSFNLVYDLPGADAKLSSEGYYGSLKTLNFQMIMAPVGNNAPSIYYGSQSFAIAPRSETGALELAVNGVQVPVLWTNPPDVSINAGRGDDTIVASASADLIDGGEGFDIVSYAKSNVGVQASLATGGATGYAAGDRFKSIEGLEGSAFADRLTGDGGDNLFRGGTGADTLDGSEGRDLADYSKSDKAVFIDLNRTQQLGGDAQGDVLISIEDIQGSNFNDLIVGDRADNKLYGNIGDDTLGGGAGNDTLDGGDGKDTVDYSDLSRTDSVSVTLNGDQSSYVEILRNGVQERDLITNFENIVGGSGNDRLSGDANVNSIQGGDGDDTLSGGAGNDTLDGNQGSDTASYEYLGATQRLSITLADTGETKATVYGALNLELEKDTLRNIENVTGGAGSDTITGNTQSNILIGGAGNDVLEGRGGDDTLDGGTGVDLVSYRYLGSHQSLSVTLNHDGSAIANVYGLGGQLLVRDQLLNIENIEGGGGDDSITGNDGNNLLIGGGGQDVIDGAQGNDTLMGGEGLDTLRGGAGNDLYIIDNADVIVESQNDGIDTVQIDPNFQQSSFTLAQNLEILDASRATNGMTLRGNSGDNTLMGSALGDLLDGGGGDDKLEGGFGNDTFITNDGDDTFVGGDGIDTVNYSSLDLGLRIEMARALDGTIKAYILNNANLPVETDTLQTIEIVIGTNNNDMLLGNSAANSLYGGEGNDTLDGGLGADYLVGGAGNDTYRVDTDDTIYEAAGGGIDTAEIGSLYLSDSFTLADNVEQIDARNAQRAMRLFGSADNNTIFGSASIDTIAGGKGDDVYVLQNAAVISENDNEGTDTVRLSAGFSQNRYVLSSNLEILDATQLSQSLLVSGNTQSNTILAGTGNDTLSGNGGGDVLDGGAGLDTADYSFLTDPAQAISANLTDGRATLLGTGAIDQLISIENLTGGAGNDYLRGDSKDNLFTGGAGSDTIDGAGGNDTASYADLNANYVLDLDMSRVVGQAIVRGTLSQTDTLIDIETIIGGDGNDIMLGNDAANNLQGGGGDDTIGGGKGADTLDGGAGRNTLTYLNQKTGIYGDPTFDTGAGWTLSDGVTREDGQLKISGLASDSALISLGGLVRNKTYQISFDYTATTDGDFVLLAGTRIVWQSTIPSGDQSGTLRFEFTLQSNDSNTITLKRIGGSFTGTIDNFFVVDGGAGVTINLENKTASGGDADGDVFNNFAHVIGSKSNDYLMGDSQNNRLIGDFGHDTLDGGAGSDSLEGGVGNDLYIVDENDLVIERSNEGFDTVQLASRFAANSYKLADNVEKLDASQINRSLTLQGNAGDNFIQGTSQADVLEGGAGNDTYVISENDVINDTSGLDTVILTGSYSPDIYEQNAGIEIIDASGRARAIVLKSRSLSQDQLTIIGTDGDDTIYGGAGNDELRGGAGNDLYYVGAKTKIVEVANAGIDTVFVTSSGWRQDGTLQTYTLDQNIENLNIDGYNNGSAFQLIGNDSNNLIVGKDRADWIIGGGGRDRLEGKEGDDTLDGGDGIDTLVGGSGNDVYIADITDLIIENDNEGIDTIQISANYSGSSYTQTANFVENIDASAASRDMTLIGSAIANTIRGSIYNDIIRSGDGNDSLLGGDGQDELRGENGNDTLEGGAGNDTLEGGKGTDSLLGDTGNDVLLADDDGNDTLDGGDGNDSVNYIGLPSSWRIQLSANNETIAQIFNDNNVLIKSDTLRAIETVIGSRGNDSFVGASADDNFLGGLGDDTLIGLGGNDSLLGDEGNDSLVGGDGRDTLLGGIGNDLLDGGDGNDSLVGGDDQDTLIGGLGNDVIDGGSDNDTASYRTASGAVIVNLLAGTSSGAAGIDTLISIENLIGSDFGDSLTGDNGPNSIDGGAGNDTLVGGLGNDTLNGGDGIDFVDYSSRTAALNINLNQILNNATLGSGEIDTLIGIENVTGGSGNDVISGNDSANRIEGGAGDDNLSGGLGDDTLVGGSGNDIMDGGAGNDTLDYSSRSTNIIASLAAGSVIIGGANGLPNETDAISNIEIIISGSGNDSLAGSGGDNTIRGGDGNDTISGAGGNDALDGEGGTNTLSYAYLTFGTHLNFRLNTNGTQQTITVLANSDVDTIQNFQNLILGAGNDTVIGNNLDNIIFGGDGNDSIDGDTGNDLLDGGNGNDVLIGVAGNDVFVIGNGNDTFDGGSGDDSISYASLASNYRLQTTYDSVTGFQRIAIIDVNSGLTLETDSIRDIETLIGSIGNDLIVGGSAADNLFGGAGNDTLDGGADNAVDVLDGEAGTNTLSYANAMGSVNVRLGLGSNAGTVTGAAGADIVRNFQNILGSIYADTLTGNSGANSIDGGAGNDILDGDFGNDTLNGGAGNDLADYSRRNVGITVSLDANSNGTAVIAESVNEVDTLQSIENVIGGSGNDNISATVIGDITANYFDGGVGNDILNSGGGNDTLIGGAGNDTLDGGADNDLAIFSGAMVDYGFSFDTVGSFWIQDSVAGRDGLDRLNNIEVLQFADGTRILSTLGNSGGTISQAAATMAMLVVTSNGNNTITTGVGSDLIISGSGNDYIVAGSGDDSVRAGDGNDTVNGGAGADSLDGGAGVNTLSYEKLTYSNGASAGFDSAAGWTLGTANTNILNISNSRLNGTNATGTLLSMALDATGTYSYSFAYANTAASAVTFSINGTSVTVGANSSFYAVGTFVAGVPSFTLSVTSGSFTGWIDTLQIVNSGVNIDLLNRTASGGDAAGDRIINFRHIIGTVGSDTIRGNAEDNLIQGQTFGLGDSLFGDAGNDTLFGTLSSDTLNGGLGNDRLDGSSNGDFFQFDWSMVAGQGWGQDTILNFELRADKLEIRNLGMSIVNQAELDELFGFTTYVAGSPITMTLKGILSLGDQQTITINGVSNDNPLRVPNFNDFLFSNQLATPWIKGSMNADTLSGTAGNDTIVALGGNDTIFASLGNDIIDGGSGNDTVSYAGWANAITINLGSTGWQSTGANTSHMLLQIEGIIGTDYNDVLTGSTGNETLQGGKGDDTLDGGVGSFDVANYSGAFTGFTTQATARYDFSQNALGQLIVTDRTAGGDGTDTLSNIEILNTGGVDYYVVIGNGIVFRAANSNPSIVIGGSGDDTIVGGSSTELLIGGAGNDLLRGNNSNDTLYGGDGDDTLIGGNGADILDGGNGRNTLSYANTQYTTGAYGTFETGSGWSTGTGTVVIAGSDGNYAPSVRGTAWAQSTTGTVLQSGLLTSGLTYNFSVDINNTTNGTVTFSFGGTTIVAAVGFGTYTGSFTASSNTFVLSASNAFSGTIDNLFMLTPSAGVNVNLQTGTATGNDATGDTISNFQNVIGSLANDTITGDGNDNRLDGWSGHDVISGGAGNDTLIGALGNDTLDGGADNDTVDYSYLQTGLTLTLAAGGAQQTVTATAGSDVDVISNIENVIGGAGSNTITGNELNNVITGGVVADTLDGGSGNDTLNGGAGGIDSLLGGLGNDTLILDVSQLTNGSRVDGGADVDVFQFAAKASATSMSATLAQLNTLLDNTETLDFTGANNRISLTGSGTGGAIDLSAGSADRTALTGIAGGAAVTIRYNASGANDQDSFGAITGAAASDATGTAGTSGYTQNYYADAAKTQLLLTLIAA